MGVWGRGREPGGDGSDDVGGDGHDVGGDGHDDVGGDGHDVLGNELRLLPMGSSAGAGQTSTRTPGGLMEAGRGVYSQGGDLGGGARTRARAIQGSRELWEWAGIQGWEEVLDSGIQGDESKAVSLCVGTGS